MRVDDLELPDQPIDALVATEDAPEAGIHTGEILSYRCELCGNADETLMQIWHDEDCDLAGEHGRQQYDHVDAPVADTSQMEELSTDHRIDIIEAAYSDRSEDVYNGKPLLFRCGECGNADETLAEIHHDEDCSLAGRHGCGAAGRAVADGGSRQ